MADVTKLAVLSIGSKNSFVIVNCKGMWKEGIVAYLALLFRRVPNKTEENSRNQIAAVICEQDLEPRPH